MMKVYYAFDSVLVMTGDNGVARESSELDESCLSGRTISCCEWIGSCYTYLSIDSVCNGRDEKEYSWYHIA